MNRLTMVEFPTTDAHSSAEFFRSVFGWNHLAYGPHYTDVQLGNEQTLGFQEDTAEAPTGPLTIIEVDDLDTAMSAVEAAQGVITVSPFDFPGGRRFHFREPGGNELAAWTRSGNGLTSTVKHLTVRPAQTGDDVARLLQNAWGGPEVVVQGRRFRLDELATLVAHDGLAIVGVLTYELHDGELEIVSCDSLRRRMGVGRALVTAARRVAWDAGSARVVCTTTNDNVGALAFWQRMGLRLTAVRPAAVDEARRIKPSIPLIGDHEIPIHDEIDLAGDIENVAT